MSKKIVVKLDLHDNNDKRKAMKVVSTLSGIDSISVDMASHKMTVIGMVDPVNVVSKLRKASWAASIESVGPAKEPEAEKKEEEEKKDGNDKKDGDAKKEGEGEKKDGEGKKDSDDKDGKKAAAAATTEQQILAELMNQYYRSYYPPMMNTPYYVQSMEENPNSCAIC